MGKRKITWLVAFVVAGIGLAAFAFFQDSGSDAEQIRKALDESILAAKEGRSGSVLELLSRDFRFNNQAMGPGRQVAEFIRDAHPDVTISEGEPIVDGDQAIIESAVSIKLGAPLNTTFELPKVRLQFRKERAAKWLIFPGHQWRLVRATSTEFPSSDFMP